MLMKSRVLMVGAASVLALSACTKQEKAAAPGATAPASTITATSNEVAATVNGTPIYKDTVDIMVKERAAQGQPDSPELRKAIIDNLAMQTLVANEAVKKGLDKKPETARQMEMLKQSLLAQAYVQDYLKNNAVTDAMVKAEYDKVNAGAGNNEYNARHILVTKEEDAKAIIAKLQKDIKQFASLAKAQSIDPGSKATGGELGWFNPAGMVPEFSAAVSKLEKGKFTTEPVKSQYGYHVIVLDDVRPITPPPMEQVADQIKQGLQRQNLKALFDKMKAEAKIDIKGAPAAVTAAPSLQSPPPAGPAPAPAPAGQ